MARESRIEGRVAAVIDDEELVINRGSEHGVEVGMRFAVLQPEAIPITDPETEESIGSLPLVKTVVKVVRVNGPRLSTARTFRTIKGTGAAFVALVSGTPDRRETFDYDEHSVAEAVEGASYSVRRGDFVVQTTGNEYD